MAAAVVNQTAGGHRHPVREEQKQEQGPLPRVGYMDVSPPLSLSLSLVPVCLPIPLFLSLFLFILLFLSRLP